MKKSYISPRISVKEMAAEQSMLAASFDPGQPSSQVNVSSTPISTPGGVGAKSASIWGDESEEDE